MRGWRAGGSDVGSQDRQDVASRFCTSTATAIRERRGLCGWVDLVVKTRPGSGVCCG